MPICCIRGAITADVNTKDEILNNTEIMLKRIIEENNLDINNIISILFTATKDLDAVYPAVAARNIGITKAGLMCAQEMYVEGSLEMCIRVLVTINEEAGKNQDELNHVYLKNAKRLRPDLAAFSVAIDGPAGSGKSTIAKLIAKKLGFSYVDTGAMYRAVALYCMNLGIDYCDEGSVCAVLDKIDINFSNEKIYLNGEDSTELVRRNEVSMGASKVASYEAVRKKLVEIQQNIARSQSIVMDGRDIGTMVLPNANVKIFMDADPSVRARRRCNELGEKGLPFDFEEIKAEIIKRDEDDRTRAISPLKKADDAIFVDTTAMGVEEVLEALLGIIKGKMV